MTVPELVCDVCFNEPGVGVAAIPGIPMSVAYGRRCLDANAHPLWALVANTAMCTNDADEWRTHTNKEWQQMVDDTLTHLGKTEDEFKTMVTADIAEFDAYVARTEEE